MKTYYLIEPGFGLDDTVVYVREDEDLGREVIRAIKHSSTGEVRVSIEHSKDIEDCKLRDPTMGPKGFTNLRDVVEKHFDEEDRLRGKTKKFTYLDDMSFPGTKTGRFSSKKIRKSNPPRSMINEGAFEDHQGNIVNSGDRVFYPVTQKYGIVSDILQDGDAYINFEDGSAKQIKWHHLVKAKK